MKKLFLPILTALLLTAVVSLVLMYDGNPQQIITNGNKSTNNGLFVPNIQTNIVAEGLDQPWDIAVLPDSSLLFTERAGTISVLKDGVKQVIYDVQDVSAVGEGGLLGMTLDSEFEDNRYVYACYNINSDIRVTRWQLANDNLSLTNDEAIVTGIPSNTTTFPGRHSGCRPRFGPDGNLWIATGDAAQSSNPQNPQSLAGKILRVDRNGKAVEGNLNEPFDPRIFSYGHRNVQGLAFDFNQSSDNTIVGYAIEHGTDKDDEINKLQTGNFGWEPGAGYDETAPMTDNNAFPDAIESLWSSGSPTIAPSGGVIIASEEWGAYEGQLAVAMLKGQHVRLFAIDNNFTETVLLQNTYGRIRVAVQGLDGGDLYIATANGNNSDQIIKLTPSN